MTKGQFIEEWYGKDQYIIANIRQVIPNIKSEVQQQLITNALETILDTLDTIENSYYTYDKDRSIEKIKKRIEIFVTQTWESIQLKENRNA